VRVTSKTVIIGVYAVLVVSCSINLVLSTFNYLHFYRAIERIDLLIVNFQWTLSDNELNLSGILVISNPERYSGLRIRVVYYEFWIINSSDPFQNYPIAAQRSWFGTEKGILLEPYSNITNTFTIIKELNEETSEILQTLRKENELVWTVKGSAWLWAFLEEPIQIFFPQKIIE